MINGSKKLKTGRFISASLKYFHILNLLLKHQREILGIESELCGLDVTDKSFLKFKELFDNASVSSTLAEYDNGSGVYAFLNLKDKTLIGFINDATYGINRLAEPLDVIRRDSVSLTEIAGSFSNTCVFRNFNIKDRKISIVNQRLPIDIYNRVTNDTLEFNKTINEIYSNLFLLKNMDMEKAVIGFISGKSYVDHARNHLGCKAAISIDISKFYDSTTLHNIIVNSMFFNVLCCGFKNLTGFDFVKESFLNHLHYEFLQELIGTINVVFINLMNYYTHNGILPTGMPYSPSVSNLLLSSIDMQIINNLDKSKTYTRYADDICISSKVAKNDNGEFIISIADAVFVENIIRANGYYLKYSKTKIMGPRDKKVIAGIILADTDKGQKLSIGTKRKLDLANQYKNKDWNIDLNAHDKGILEWVRSINYEQFMFIVNGISNVPENKKIPVAQIERNTDSLLESKRIAA